MWAVNEYGVSTLGVPGRYSARIAFDCSDEISVWCELDGATDQDDAERRVQAMVDGLNGLSASGQAPAQTPSPETLQAQADDERDRRVMELFARYQGRLSSAVMSGPNRLAIAASLTAAHLGGGG